jgi:tRNA (guanosine-2'-O-)-methyltransferase
MKINPERYQRIVRTVSNRQLDMAVVLEHLSDLHNMGAVLRTCETVGIQKVHIIPNPEEKRMKNFGLGKRTTAGARKWLDVYTHETIDDCVAYIRKSYGQIFCTAIGKEARSLYTTDLTQSTAIVLGNEKEGVSERALELSDGNLLIPMMGMVQSLNVSVACSVILFEALRQRMNSGMYEVEDIKGDVSRKALLEDFLHRHESQYKGKKPKEL